MRSVPKLIAGCLLLAASECPAQTSPTEVARRELLQGADAARAAGDHPRALDLARRAGEIRMTPSVRLLLAQESEVATAAIMRDIEALLAAQNNDKKNFQQSKHCHLLS